MAENMTEAEAEIISLGRGWGQNQEEAEEFAPAFLGIITPKYCRLHLMCHMRGLDTQQDFTKLCDVLNLSSKPNLKLIEIRTSESSDLFRTLCLKACLFQQL